MEKRTSWFYLILVLCFTFHHSLSQDRGQIVKAGDNVLDPYLGIGTTATVCMQEGRNLFGYEINEEYFKIANEKKKQTKLEMVK